MTLGIAKTSLSDSGVRAVVSFCNAQNLSRETFYVAAWLYTLSVYSAASSVTTHVVRSSQDRVHTLAFPASATLEEHMTVSDACSALQITETCSSIDSEIFFGKPTCNIELHNGGTVVKFARDEAAGLDCDIKGPIRATLMVDSRGSVNLRFLPNAIPALSAEAFLETFTTIVERFSTSPHDTLLSKLDILGPLNRTTLETWSPSSLSTMERCIHDYVDEHAQINPQREAVVATEGPNFTYDVLSVLSSKLAIYLLRFGIKGGEVVPILFDKSSVAVLAIISILKAGCAYVGFSAETPVNFLRECSSIADASLIITSRQHEHLVKKIGRRALVLDQDFLLSLERSVNVEGFSSPAHPSDLAYLVFTSGSTGTPKAVMTEHRAYVTDALAQQKSALLDDTSRVFHFASYNFDATNFDVLSTLIAGGTICVPTEFDRINRLAGAINDLGANFIGVTATIAQTLDPEDVPLLRVVILCGEANTTELVDKWTKPVAGGRDVINGYGPSEASCAFSYNVYTRQSPATNNIGRALEGACWGWVVNPNNHGQLLPIGARGELLIQGPTLSRGYLKEPEKTARAFIESPDWLMAETAPGLSRLYKTGDLVRQLPDQSYEVFGRIDTQVKLNGQRIELGEIEHKISRVLRGEYIIAVEALNLCFQEQGNSKVLVAFYASSVDSRQKDDATLHIIDRDESAVIDVQDIKTRLVDDLKAIAIPQIFVPLCFMPITIQGKLDRKFLQALGGHLDKSTLAKFSGVTASADGDPVRTDYEKMVQELFARSLNLSKELIFRDSDFFALGGDSVKGIKLVSLARKLGVNLSVPDILQTPQLSCLAELLRKSNSMHEVACEYQPFDAIIKKTAGDEIRTKAAQYVSMVEDVEDVIPATDLQASCVGFSTYNEERRGINWLLCDFVTPYDKETVIQMCEYLSARHTTLRTFFVAHRRTLYQVVSKSFQPPIRTHLHLKDIHETTNCLMEYDMQTRTVDMTQPQTAFDLLSHSDATSIERVVIRVSAGQYDGHSVAILGREMTSILKNNHHPPQLRELQGSYPAYLHRARAAELEKGIEYWRSLLKGAKMPEITKRKACSGDTPSNLDFVDGVLVKMVETRLLDLVTKNMNTVINKSSGCGTRATIVKTAWALTLARLTGKNDVVFGSTGWGRNSPVEFAQDVMGSCTSHIPTRAQLNNHAGGSSPPLTYGELVCQLQAQHIASMRFENVGANVIVDKCTPWRRWTRFSSLLVFQGLDIETPQRGGHESNNNQEKVVATVRLTEIMDPGDRADLIVHVEPFGEKTRLMMAFSKKNVPEDVAGTVLRTFERYLEVISQSPDQPIELGDHFLPPLLPVIRKDVSVEELEEPDVNSGVDAKAETIVREAWINVLDVDADGVDQLKEEKVSYLDLWGNPVAAAALAHEYQKNGFAVSTEDMLRNQTFQKQIRMISSVIGING